MTDPASIHLLIVDDHPLVRDGLRLRLGMLPSIASVGEAGSAGEAWDWMERCPPETAPNLVLMDVGMKDTNGIDLTAALLESYPELRILILSMYDNPEYVHRALQAGARGYVLKDAPASDIVSAIDTVAAGGTYLSAAVSGRLFSRPDPKPVLTPREAEILKALGQGQSSKQIARDLDVSVRTVETHRQSIKRKLGIEGQAELIKVAVERTRD
jgi:DNA-binding NarL/FixJ family response regulator